MVATTVDHFGRLDILVNNAAVTFVGDLDIPLKRHELLMAINLTAPLVACHAAAPHLKAAGGGRILNVSSVAALLPIPGLMSYGISKIGLEHLTVDLARILQADGIAVNCFRIDLAVASEGFIANTPGVDRSTWEPCEVAAEGVLWMLQQPATLLRSAREHGRPPPARGDHGQPSRGRHAATARRPPSSSTASCPTREPCSGSLRLSRRRWRPSRVDVRRRLRLSRACRRRPSRAP